MLFKDTFIKTYFGPVAHFGDLYSVQLFIQKTFIKITWVQLLIQETFIKTHFGRISHLGDFY